MTTEETESLGEEGVQRPFITVDLEELELALHGNKHERKRVEEKIARERKFQELDALVDMDIEGVLNLATGPVPFKAQINAVTRRTVSLYMRVDPLHLTDVKEVGRGRK